METILLKYFLCMMGVIGLVVLANILIWLLRELSLTWREMKEKQKEECQQQEKTTCPSIPPVLLTPKERRECMLNHIEDGRFYVISSSSGSDTTIVCAQRYDSKKQMLYCYAYLWISGYSVYNLHVSDPRGIIKLRGFIGNKPLRIDFDCKPHLAVFEEDHISPYIEDRDYNAFVQGLKMAGFDWKIEKGEESAPGSYKYILKETITKQQTTIKQQSL